MIEIINARRQPSAASLNEEEKVIHLLGVLARALRQAAWRTAQDAVDGLWVLHANPPSDSRREAIIRAEADSLFSEFNQKVW